MTRRVLLLGSTGSIGAAALDVARALRDEIEIVGLAAGNSWEKLAAQALEFGVRSVAIADAARANDLRRRLPAETRVFAGAAGLVDLVRETDADFVLAAIVGAAGLPATLAAVERGLDIGLANKESLVVAGSILMPLVKSNGGKLIPIDSEHSAIFQAMHAGRPEEVRRIYLTASGGPFRTWNAEKIADATLEQALDHPVWSMGPKITIDSATMMNKALEIVEAHHLFGLRVDQIEVLIHPESIVHSMVEFADGSLIAQLGTPDMRTPIQYAMTFPHRKAAVAPTLCWKQARRLHFEPPDAQRFPALRLGFEAARAGGTSGAVFNAANEAAVEAFRAARIGFGRITTLIEQTLRRHALIASPTLEELLAADAWARQEVERCIER
ncbi:1-deoxy-D-xylulose 5-phosphate reductoisomerase [Phycisphaerae bacterium RAS1]|nr:1-deoxy-D-xylulose 5-phosphate reductoisomerase [Phycisphaerae bacterium RAS1]